MERIITASQSKTLILGHEKRLEIARRNRQFIHRKTDRLTELVNDVLGINKKESEKLARQRVHEETRRLTDQVKEILDRNKNIW